MGGERKGRKFSTLKKWRRRRRKFSLLCFRRNFRLLWDFYCRPSFLLECSSLPRRGTVRCRSRRNRGSLGCCRNGFLEFLSLLLRRAEFFSAKCIGARHVGCPEAAPNRGSSPSLWVVASAWQVTHRMERRVLWTREIWKANIFAPFSLARTQIRCGKKF